MRHANIYVRGIKAGVVGETDERYSFGYDHDYLDSEHPLAVSLTLPLTAQEYTSPTLFSFFDSIIA